jgi:transposase
MYAFLLDRKNKSEDASKELGVDYNFTWLGFTLDEWKNDFQTRVNQISIQEKRKELAEIEARLNAIISPELKAQMELEAISEILGK